MTNDHMAFHSWTEAQASAAAAVLRAIFAAEVAGIITTRRADHQAREWIFFTAEGGDAAKHSAAKPHSIAARALRACTTGSKFRSSVRVDHAIPWRTMRGGLRAAAMSGETLMAFLRATLHVCLITLEEDAVIRRAGLTSAMPNGADPTDPMARYRMAGISV